MKIYLAFVLKIIFNHVFSLSTRWGCLRSTLRSQNLFPPRQNPSSSPASSRTPTNVRWPGTCSKICFCVKTSKAKRTRSHLNPQVTSATHFRHTFRSCDNNDPGWPVCSYPWCAWQQGSFERKQNVYSPATTQSCQTPHNTFLRLAAVWISCDLSKLLSAGHGERTYTSNVKNIGGLGRGGVWEKSSMRKISKAQVRFTFMHDLSCRAPRSPQTASHSFVFHKTHFVLSEISGFFSHYQKCQFATFVYASIYNIKLVSTVTATALKCRSCQSLVA